MAVKYKDLVKAVKEKPLTPEQIDYVYKLESYIDEKLLKWDPLSNYPVVIDLCIARMEYNPFTKSKTMGLDVSTKQKMVKMLDDLYINAGWKIEKKIDDSIHAHDTWELLSR